MLFLLTRLWRVNDSRVIELRKSSGRTNGMKAASHPQFVRYQHSVMALHFLFFRYTLWPLDQMTCCDVLFKARKCHWYLPKSYHMVFAPKLVFAIKAEGLKSRQTCSFLFLLTSKMVNMTSLITSRTDPSTQRAVSKGDGTFKLKATH